MTQMDGTDLRYLSGASGVGKTMSVERILREEPDWQKRCAPVISAGQILSNAGLCEQVADALGVTARPGAPKREAGSLGKLGSELKQRAEQREAKDSLTKEQFFLKEILKKLKTKKKGQIKVEFLVVDEVDLALADPAGRRQVRRASISTYSRTFLFSLSSVSAKKPSCLEATHVKIWVWK